jgi:hypothetical protein
MYGKVAFHNHKWTPMRRVVNRAGAVVSVEKLCFCLVVEGDALAGLYAGTPEAAWDAASELSRQLHIIRKEDFASRKAEAVLLAPKASEMLYHLKNPPAWAGGGAPAMAMAMG